MKSTTANSEAERKFRPRFSVAKVARNVFTVFTLSLIGLLGISMTSKQPDNLGATNGKLAT